MDIRSILYYFWWIIFSLSSCGFDGLSSYIDDKYNDFINGGNTSQEDNDSRTIELLNNAFNAKQDSNGNSFLEDFSNVESNNEFENATRLNFTKNALDLDYYNYYTPTSGTINGLVIPVEFSDARASNLKIPNDLYPTYQSVSSYYYNSSYGKLNMNFDVLDWQMMSRKSTYYDSILSSKYYGDAPGVSAIIHEVLANIERMGDHFENIAESVIVETAVNMNEEVEGII